jgi:cystathionine beta-lyase family protein involved in aluminum resistance
METVTASRVLVRAVRHRDHMLFSIGEPYDAAGEDCLKRT